MARPTTRSLLSDQDVQRPSVISQTLQNSDQVNDEDCPWVRIKNGLYVSVTMTGENSWLPLVGLLHGGGVKKYTVFTGRHGNIPNIVDDNGVAPDIFDASHVEEDQQVKQLAVRELSGIDIELVDTRMSPRYQTQWLQRETRSRLGQGRSVIYSWCYGLFTMCEAPSDLTKARWAVNFQSNQTFLVNRSVADLVRDNWFWVPA